MGFASRQECVDFLSREIDIAGGFKRYDKDGDGVITKDEFYATFEQLAPKVIGRYFFEDDGRPTKVYRNTIDAADWVFEKGGVLKSKQVEHATNPQNMGALIAFADRILRGSEGAHLFDKKPNEKTEEKKTSPQQSQEQTMGEMLDTDHDGFVSRKEVENYIHSRDSEIKDEERPLIPEIVNDIFDKGDKRLPVKKFDQRIEEMFKTYDGKPSGMNIHPDVKKQIAEALNSSIIQPLNPVALNQIQKNTEKLAEVS